ncbi:Fe3+-hydroxamate ABC transporter periplasmic protein [Haloterrigena salina JCM 13891]|uniref:Fe3+-hydroxamate ABC transporter periplasmic protein n=1 Tax=Haloterrigena salina JCM 13891 TaxID=1227488 RepID=M0CME4_9EURY|nr:ABC transporter substrate-binding protein [Haloterrigena salina]ELZ23024.1 Fe3+-hydroxamate ABC transporter periplasmic protein [Haloterrigena salina JCM 13891]
MAGKRRWGRRDVLRTSGVAIVGAATVGCLGSDGDGGNGEADDDGDTGDNVTDANTAGSNGTDGTDDTDATDETTDTDEDDEEPSDDGSYTVSMPPVGEVEFESVPETWAANNGSWVDMGVALGQEPPEALYLAWRYHTAYYDAIPDVSVDPDGIHSLWEYGLAVEKFLQVAEAVEFFAMDPELLKNRGDLTADDIAQVESTGTPFFGNSIVSQDYRWHDDYDYLTLYEAFEKLAEVFQEREHYEAFASLHDEFQSILSDTVPANVRPEVAVLWPQDEESFLPSHIDGGTSFKHLRDLEVEDALASHEVSHYGQIDYETLLEVDPEYILLRSEQYLTESAFQERRVEPMQSHSVGQELTAVQNGNVYRAGPLHQGPIINLVVTQRMAERLYDIDEQLYDPQAVSDIVNGDF